MAPVKTGLLLSGGMDSTALAFLMRPEIAITIDYGQLSARGEVRAAAAVSHALSIEHCLIHVDMRELGSGEMAGKGAAAIAPVPEWWPFRNQMLITVAAMKAISLGVTRLAIGTVSTDSSHADGRRDFVEAMNSILQLQEGGLSLAAPAIEMTSDYLIRTSAVPSRILAWAHSCHVAEFACGTCRGCRKHYASIASLGEKPY